MGHIFDGNIAQGYARVHYGDQYVTHHNYAPGQHSASVVGPLETKSPREHFMEILEFPEMNARYETIEQNHAGSCSWLPHKPVWLEWLDPDKTSSHNGLIWIKGNPGSGKSTMMRYAFRTTEKQLPDSVVLSYFFHARGVELERSIRGMYRVLLYQIMEKLPRLECILETLQSSYRRLHDLKLEMLKEALRLVLQHLGTQPLICFIDALDECNDEEIQDMVNFFEELGGLAVTSGARFHVCFSSRRYPYITIKKGLELEFDKQAEHKADIEEYVRSELRIGESRQAQEIKSQIEHRASGTFLWVYLVVRMLNKAYKRGRIHELQKRLADIPNGLETLFQAIVHDDTHDKQNLILTLQWILFAGRPLKPEELYFAIRCGQDDTAAVPWNRNELTLDDMQRFILDSSRGLAEITRGKDQTVQLIHESVRTYLAGSRGLVKLRPQLRNNLVGSSHDELKRICHSYILTFLSLEPEKVNKDWDQHLNKTRVERWPFISYAVWAFLRHANAAQHVGVSQTTFLRSLLLDGRFSIDKWYRPGTARDSRSSLREVPRIYLFADYHLNSLLELDLKQADSLDIEWRSSCVEALCAAVLYDNKQGVQLLIDAGADPLSKCLYGCTPLDVAIEKGDKNMFFTLFNRGANVGMDPKGDGRRLYQAALTGHAEIVQALSRAGANTDASAAYCGGRYGTALQAASVKGHINVVKVLIAPGADVACRNARKSDYITPLIGAICKGHSDIVSLLLQYEKSFQGWPLHAAAIHRRKEIVTQLIMCGDDIDKSHGDLGTALHTMSATGDKEMVELLLSKGAKADYNCDKLGTPLHVALARGHLDIAELLLQHKGAASDASHEDIGTPLHLASYYGWNTMAELLLRKRANVNAGGGVYSSALRAASIAGHKAVVQTLLFHGADVNFVPQRSPRLRRTIAANSLDSIYKDCPNVMKELHYPRGIDQIGGTALQEASWAGHSAIVELLLQSGANVGAAKPGCATALELARNKCHNDVVGILLEYDGSTNSRRSST